MHLMTLLHYFVLLKAVANAINQDTKNIIRASFEHSNKLWHQLPENDKMGANENPFVKHLKNDFYFYQVENMKWTFAIVAPQDSSGKFLAQLLIKETESLHRKSGFQPASKLFKDVFWNIFSSETHWGDKAALIFATRHGESLELVNDGLLWAGLFRLGVLINETKYLEYGSEISFRPDGLIARLFEEYRFRFDDLKEEWSVRSGDVLIITWRDSRNQLKEVMEIAMETGKKLNVPISQVLSNLKPYFNIYQSRENVLAGIEII